MAEKKNVIYLTIKENEGKTTFKGVNYYKYKVYDSFGHYFTKLLKNDYKAGDEVPFLVRSYKNEISLKAEEV